MVPIPLTKAFAGQPDLDALAQEIAWLGPEVLAGQSEARAWEYGLALHAIQRWAGDPALDFAWPRRVLDVGGAGSRFGDVLGEKLGVGWEIELVDPKEGTSLEARTGEPASVILAVSVIEHVPEPTGFLQAVAANLVKGGLAFLTMDGKGTEGPDVQHFHWMRERIYTPGLWTMLAAQAGALGLDQWGGADWTYHGDQVYIGPTGYSFLSLCLRKRE